MKVNQAYKFWGRYLNQIVEKLPNKFA